MPCSFAASATALNQDRCRCFSVVILFIRCIFGKLHVFHRSLDQILVFICSTFEDTVRIECIDAHPEYSDLATQSLVVAACKRCCLRDRAISGPACVASICGHSARVPVPPALANPIWARRSNLIEVMNTVHLR